MFRLQWQMNSFAVGILVLTAVAVLATAKLCPTATETQIHVLIVAYLGTAMVASVLFFENAAPKQALRISLTTLGIAIVASSLAYFFSPLPFAGSLLTVPLVPLILANVGAVAAARALFTLVPLPAVHANQAKEGA